MASSGVNNLFKLVGGWTLGLALSAFAFTHNDAIRDALDFRIVATPADTGTSEPEVREIIRYVERPAEPGDSAGPRSQSRRTSASRGRGEDDLFKKSVQLRRGYGGHFHADAQINGRSISVLVDTGATLVAMSYEDAQAAGIHVRPGDFRYVSNTANGQAKFARVTLDEVRIGNVSVRNVDAAVSQPGRLSKTLLGMSFLGQLRMEMQAGMLVLEQ